MTNEDMAVKFLMDAVASWQNGEKVIIWLRLGHCPRFLFSVIKIVVVGGSSRLAYGRLRSSMGNWSFQWGSGGLKWLTQCELVLRSVFVLIFSLCELVSRREQRCLVSDPSGIAAEFSLL